MMGKLNRSGLFMSRNRKPTVNIRLPNFHNNFQISLRDKNSSSVSLVAKMMMYSHIKSQPYTKISHGMPGYDIKNTRRGIIRPRN